MKKILSFVIIILITIILFNSCDCGCGVNSSKEVDTDFTAIKIEMYDKDTHKYKGYVTLYEFEYEGHVYLIKISGNGGMVHSPNCPCHKTVTTNEPSNILKQESFFDY